MKAIITGGALAALLVLGACNKPAEDADTAAATDAEVATSADTAGSNAGGSSTARRSSSAAAPAATDVAPAADAATVPDTGSGAAPVSPETRDQAKEKAESTNLHPAG